MQSASPRCRASEALRRFEWFPPCPDASTHPTLGVAHDFKGRAWEPSQDSRATRYSYRLRIVVGAVGLRLMRFN